MNYIKSLDGQEIKALDDNLVGGYYGTDTVDVDGHIIFKEDYIEKMQEYVQWGNVRNNHKDPVGVLHEYDPSKWDQFIVRIPDAQVMSQVRNGVLKGFSIGIKADESGLMRIPLSQIPKEKYSHLPSAVIKKIERLGYVIRIKDFYIFEISITDRPKNTRARITFHKSEDGECAMPTLEDLSMEEEIKGVDENVDTNSENTEQIIESNESAVDEVTKSEESPADVEVVSPVATEVVEAAEIVKSDVEEVKADDASLNLLKSFDELSAKVEALSALMREIGEKIDKGVSVESTVGISKSEMMEIPQTPAIDVEELKSFIATTVNDAVSKLDTSNVERVGVINKGDSNTEVVEKLNIATMGKDEAYSTIANIVARRLKS